MAYQVFQNPSQLIMQILSRFLKFAIMAIIGASLCEAACGVHKHCSNETACLTRRLAEWSSDQETPTRRRLENMNAHTDADDETSIKNDAADWAGRDFDDEGDM